VQSHTVRTYKSAEPLARADQLAWKIAEVAADPVAVQDDVAEMIGNRIIDNAAVAAAALARRPVISARAQGRAHGLPSNGANIFGVAPTERASARNGPPGRMGSRCASSISTTPSCRRLLASRRQHPADPGRRADHVGLGGAELVRGIATGYEIQVDLARGICLHEHKIDHIAHLVPRPRPASAPC
jgi:2-methylcitrate dehydratase